MIITRSLGMCCILLFVYGFSTAPSQVAYTNDGQIEIPLATNSILLDHDCPCEFRSQNEQLLGKCSKKQSCTLSFISQQNQIGLYSVDVVGENNTDIPWLLIAVITALLLGKISLAYVLTLSKNTLVSR